MINTVWGSTEKPVSSKRLAELLSAEEEVRLTELSNDELLRFVSLDISRATAEE